MAEFSHFVQNLANELSIVKSDEGIAPLCAELEHLKEQLR